MLALFEAISALQASDNGAKWPSSLWINTELISQEGCVVARRPGEAVPGRPLGVIDPPLGFCTGADATCRPSLSFSYMLGDCVVPAFSARHRYRDHLEPAPTSTLPGNSPGQAEVVLPVSFILGTGGSVVAGKMSALIRKYISWVCFSSRTNPLEDCWYFTERLSAESGPYVCIYMYICVLFLLQVTGERRVWVLIRVCVGSSADAVCQLESQHRALRHQPRLPFCLLSHLEGREDVAESCNSRSKHTAALKIRAKAFLYKHMVLFILLFSLSNAYLPLQSRFQPQGKRVCRWKESWASDWSGSHL